MSNQTQNAARSGTANDRFTVYIDELRLDLRSARELVIRGWAGNCDFESFPTIEIEAGGNWAPLRVGIERDDVARRFGKPGMSNPGFAGRLYVDEEASFFNLRGRDKWGDTILLSARIPGPDFSGSRNKYEDWLERNERNLFWKPEEIPSRVAGLRRMPLISVIVPTYNTDPYHLYRCVYSLLLQHYPCWQLCLSDDGSRDPETLRLLDRLSSLDPRIRVRLSGVNAGISAASMTALEMADGEFIVLLDHDDELHRHALLEIARQINLTPDADLIYSDEDKIDEIGDRSGPAFKPGYDPEMLLTFSYIGHIVCVRATTFRGVGGLRSKFDGAQDWDLLIRISEVTPPERIKHIPKPLYHWRMHPESTSMNLDAKPYSQAAWRTVLEDRLRRRGERARVEKGIFLGSMRIRYEVNPEIRTAVVLRLDDGNLQYAAAKRARMPERMKFFELWLTTLRRIDSEDIVLTLEEMAADVIVFINIPLDRINHFFYEELVAQCQKPGCGLVTGPLVDERGRNISGGLESQRDGMLLNPAEGMELTSYGYMGRFRVVHMVPAVAPHFFAVRAELLGEIGGLARLDSDRFGVVSQELAALCHRKGLHVLFTPFAVATARTPLELDDRSRGGTISPMGLELNPNLGGLTDVVEALRYGI